MNRTVLQIPIAPALRQQAEAASLDLGFSSLQDAVRLLLHKLARRELTVEVRYPEERLSPRAERRYGRIIRDIKSGKEKTVSFDRTKEMMTYLHSL